MYGESRVIVGAHWQSDVDASRLAAAIGLARLHTSPVFLAQLNKAQEEFKQLKGTLSPTEDASQFVNLADAVPDAILEIRYYSTYNFVGTRVDGYLEPIALLTRQAADSLRAVSDDLKQMGYRLKIFDAYRPQCAVNHFVRWGADVNDTLMKQYFYPEVPRDKLFELGYIAKKSGHTRGSTVDLTLFDMTTEKEVDMGGTFDWFGRESHTDFGGNPNTGKYKANDRITAEQFHNRMILREAMLRHGFKPIDEEWWHFTLKNEPFPKTYFTFPVKKL
ncbi:MAG: peptidase M15 [Bacteroidales bacterium]|nr:peptidase M15 [Bacteroidales bacterium]